MYADRKKLSQTPKEYINGLIAKTNSPVESGLPTDFQLFGDQFYRVRYGAEIQRDQTSEYEMMIQRIRAGLEVWKKQQHEAKKS